MSISDMTIVHLSEFHLQAADKQPTGIPYEDLLDGYGDALNTLDHLRAYVSKPDLFVVTGDLVLGGRNAEAGYPRLGELLQQFKAEYYKLLVKRRGVNRVGGLTFPRHRRLEKFHPGIQR